jgi:hypothetical protein
MKSRRASLPVVQRTLCLQPVVEVVAVLAAPVAVQLERATGNIVVCHCARLMRVGRGRAIVSLRNRRLCFRPPGIGCGLRHHDHLLRESIRT